MNAHELAIIEEVVKGLNISKVQKLQNLMPRIDTFLLYVLVMTMKDMNERVLRILQEVD